MIGSQLLQIDTYLSWNQKLKMVINKTLFSVFLTLTSYTVLVKSTPHWIGANELSIEPLNAPNRTRPCPCMKLEFCQPIETNPKKEVFIFSVNNKNWKKYDWNKITTVVIFGYIDDDLTCYAHSQNARVVFGANFPKDNLTSPTDRQNWIKEKLTYAQSNFLDGINVDFESTIPDDQPATKEGLTLLIKGLASAFRGAFKNPQVSVDVAWSPDCIDLRCYDYVSIASIADISFIMAYDERSQIIDECIAWANSAINTTLHGFDLKSILPVLDIVLIMAYDVNSQNLAPNSPYNLHKLGIERYLRFGQPAHKFVLGLPWYGYDYECLNYSRVDNKCLIKKVPFRGVECSDAAGSQFGYSKVIQLLQESTTGRLWDPVGLSPYFTYMNKETRKYHQIWYDDPESLNLKNTMADQMGLGGYGMWNADSVDYSDTPDAKRQREALWNTFPNK